MAEDKAPAIRLIIDNEDQAHDDDRRGGPRGPGGGSAGGPEDHRSRAVFASEDHLGVLLSDDLGPEFLFIRDASYWVEWSADHWAKRDVADVRERSRLSSRRLSLDISDGKLAREVCSRGRTHNAAVLAAQDDRHKAEMDDFDRHDFVLNTHDGEVDLRTGHLGRHDRSKLITKVAPSGVGGECPRFERFIAEATGGDGELASFLQRVAGYCATGSVEEHAIFFLYDNGIGGTGKSTFQSVLSEVLGPYAATASMELITEATGERHPVDFAVLAGARLVTASETSEGRRWDEARLKQITGGDRITARFMRGNPFSFRPQFKLLISGNHRPRMRSADGAMRRRFHMIPFLHRPAAPDRELLAKLREEYPGILKWAIAGEMERQRLGGLKPPAVVVAATDEYFEAENPVARWIEERCDKAPGLEATTRALYRGFKSWAAAAGEFPLSERLFAQKLQSQPGLQQCRLKEGRGFRGLVLRTGTGELPLDGVGPGEGGEQP